MNLTAEEAAAGVVLLAGVLGALGYIGKRIRRVVHIVDRIEAMVEPTHQVVAHELTHNSGSSMKDAVTSLERFATTNRRGIERVGEQVAVVDFKVQSVREEIHTHGEQSRAAMAIYRRALADQGIHLPVAPGEDGYGDTEEHHHG